MDVMKYRDIACGGVHFRLQRRQGSEFVSLWRFGKCAGYAANLNGPFPEIRIWRRIALIPQDPALEADLFNKVMWFHIEQSNREKVLSHVK